MGRFCEGMKKASDSVNIRRCEGKCLQFGSNTRCVENMLRCDKCVQTYTNLHCGILAICLPASPNPILPKLLSFGAALHRL